MRYLNCVEMSNYILRKILKEDSRMPVPISKMNELLTCLTSLKDMMTEEQITDPMVVARLNDIMQAVLAVNKSNIGMTNLAESMKSELISGINEIRDHICLKAYSYYCDHEFEPTEENKPVLIDIATVAAKCGCL